MTAACLTFRDLTLGYNSHPAVHHLNGTIRKGSLTAVVGANGSGKSTLMKGIVGVLKPMAGDGAFAHPACASPICRSNRNSTAPFRPASSTWFRSACGRSAACSAATPRRIARRSAKALMAVGLGGFEKRPIDTLSGGQLQRTLFARVLLQDADLILLDEPFNAVDAKTVGDLIALIKRWHGEERTIMVVVHDLDLVRAAFSRDAASGPPADRLGRDARDAAAGKPAARPPLRRGLGRRRALVRAGRARSRS